MLTRVPVAGCATLKPKRPSERARMSDDGRTAAPCVRDHDDLELEALGGVDREQPDGVGALLLRHRVRLLRPDRLLPLDEADEALDVGAAELLVRPREPRELAQVRVPAAAVRDARARRGRSRARRGCARRGARASACAATSSKPLVALPESQQEPPIALRRGRPAADARAPGTPAAAAPPPGSGRARRSTRRRTATRAPSSSASSS